MVHELVGVSPAEQYWQNALATGIKETIILHQGRGGEFFLLGRTFEFLGYALVSESYPPPKFILTAPPKTSFLKNFFAEGELERWQPCFPDGILFERTEAEGVLRIKAIVEYKVSDPRNMRGLQYQFDGFENLLALLRCGSAARNKEILGECFDMNIPLLEVPQEVKFIYVVPQGRTVVDVPTSRAARANFVEMIFPQNPQDIRERIRQILADTPPALLDPSDIEEFHNLKVG